jgi:Ca2+-transporting ATPase
VTLATRRLAVNPRRGLDVAEAARRLDAAGPNRLAEKPPAPIWSVFLGQFRSLLILMLVGASGLAAAVGQFKDATGILVAVILNAVLGFVQEYRAERSLAALKRMLALKARVRRDGKIMEVATEALVPGDIVLLDAGDRVPADGRLVVSQNLELDESALTGESHPAAKQAEQDLAEATPLAERSNLAHLGTMVTRGRGELAVTATGMETVVGRLSASLAETPREATPLQAQLDQLGKRLAAVGLTLVAIIFAIGILRGKGLYPTLMQAIALAVATIPEGLPAVVTVTLALGMSRMARNKAIVKRLAAVETLGCTTVICSDKTGTLTLNQMTVRALVYQGHFFGVTGEGYRTEGDIVREVGDGPPPDFAPLLEALALCNDSRLHGEQVVGDPLEGAMLVLAAKGRLDVAALEARRPRVAEVPFDSAAKFMATCHEEGEGLRLYVKGAPEVVLARCADWLGERGAAPLGAVERDRILEYNDVLAGRHLRVLAVAARALPAAGFDRTAPLAPRVERLTFLGLIGLMDAPRPEARHAIAVCRRAGILVKMITGDQRGTAGAIARELGMEGRVVTGAELNAIPLERLPQTVEAYDVFARVEPEHKLRIVQALKRAGHIVAMTGDGVNDAPALKSAHIGVAMGVTGTEVAKEAAGMVLTDDNFANIVRAVRAGRTIYDNIVKFVRFQLSTNIGAMLTMLTAALLGLPDPFNPIQILWVNIIMDGPPAMALGLERSRPEIMLDRPRTPGAQILPLARLAHLLYLGAVMALGTLGVLLAAQRWGAAEQAPTLAFVTFVLFQLCNVFNARAERGSTLDRYFFTNRMLWLSVSAMAALQVLVVQWAPARAVFHTEPLRWEQWAAALAVASSIFLLEEARKLLARLFLGRGGGA